MWFQPIKNNIMLLSTKYISIVLSVLTFSTINLKAQPTFELTTWLDSLLTKYVTESGIVGIGASVIYKDSIIFSNGFGYMDLQNRIEFTPNTIMNIGSVSKVMTGISVLHVYNNHDMSIYEPINKLLPFPMGKNISLQQIMTHTSSINDVEKTYLDSYYYGSDSPVPLGDFLKDYLSKEGALFSENSYLENKPGEYWQYSNIAAGLEGYLVECITDTALNIYSKKHFFEPLGMTSTGWLLTEVDTSRHSKLYEYKNENENYKIYPKYGLTTYPDGGLRTTINDLSKFMIFLANRGKYQNNIIICDSIIDSMFTTQFETGELDKYFQFDDVNNWGLNLEINELDNGQIVVGHSGSDPGVATQLWYNIDTEIGIILFINTRDFEYEYQTKMVKALWDFGEKYTKTISR
jgi:CubicO group peptidase (beta-lactamase class C family)